MNKEIKDIAKDFVKPLVIMALATMLSLALQGLEIRAENILMIYVLSILIIIVETKSIFIGILSSLICILTFNFLFTAPKYTLMVDDPNYYISFVIFIIVAFIASTLTSRLQKQISISKENENRTNNLYKISNGYLNISGIDNIINYGVNSLEMLINKKCILYFDINKDENLKAFESKKYKVNSLIDNASAEWCFKNSVPCGCGESAFADLEYKYLPIKVKNKTAGVLAIYCENEVLSDKNMIYINTMLSQLAITAERELSNLAEEKSRMSAEKEKLKSNLLRSISHDLRTPLTGISGSAGFLLDSYKDLDDETIKSLLSDIINETSWLSGLVENLLNMTRIQDGRLLIKLKNEVVDDIVSEAVGRISKRLVNHTIKTKTPEDILLAPMDGGLIIQVLVNILDNAIKHTREDSDISIGVFKNKLEVVFEISDNGGGIKSEVKDKIFDSFVTASTDIGDNYRGIGLGLSICKSIIEAHGGRITAENNDIGGATFKFYIPAISEVDVNE